LVCHVQTKLGVSERRACNAIGHPRSTQRYVPRVRDGECELTAKIHKFATKHPRYGYRRIHGQLVRQGFRVNRKRVHRIWRPESPQKAAQTPPCGIKGRLLRSSPS
jgi:putative transposase